jgi:hypothetical protein
MQMNFLRRAGVVWLHFANNEFFLAKLVYMEHFLMNRDKSGPYE